MNVGWGGAGVSDDPSLISSGSLSKEKKREKKEKKARGRERGKTPSWTFGETSLTIKILLFCSTFENVFIVEENSIALTTEFKHVFS